MANTPHKLVSLPNRSYQAMARSEIKKIAAATGFSKKRMAELEIVVAEITTNLVKHASKGGHILVKQLPEDNPGIEMISIDDGPGMSAVAKMMEDGISTTNTMGHGLGAIKRLSDDFDIYSQKDWGTILLSRIYVHKPAAFPKKTVDIRTVMIAKEGETSCGDNYEYIIKGNQVKIVVSDGLGHGEDASIAATASLLAFRNNYKTKANELLKLIHTEIRKTRGVVMSITDIDFNNKQFSYCGIGNITAKLVGIDHKQRSCISYNGIVGHSVPSTIHNHMYQWAKNDLLIIHSDGLSTRWDLQKYPSITKHDCSIIVAALYKDHNRGNDDVTILAITQKQATK
ncbi:MAG: ATP-binding protein [Ferruginibacter sp.]